MFLDIEENPTQSRTSIFGRWMKNEKCQLGMPLGGVDASDDEAPLRSLLFGLLVLGLISVVCLVWVLFFPHSSAVLLIYNNLFALIVVVDIYV